MAKVVLKKMFTKDGKKKNVENKNNEHKMMIIAFEMLAIFCIILFSMAVTPKSYQNDTFYTIKIGQDIRKYGIDYKDHYSWHNLPYMYPHWLYDVFTSLIYDFCGGFTGVYIATIIFACILGIVTFYANKKFSKNELISFIMTMFQMYFMKDYIAARAQLVTFILFELTIILIEKFLEKPKIRYVVGLALIPLVIANIHSAVFPFYFVLYLPYLAEYVICTLIDSHFIHKIHQFNLKTYIKYANNKLKKADKEKAKYYQGKLAELNKKLEKSNENFEKFLLKQNENRKNPYKIKLVRNDNVEKLFFVMIIAVFTGVATPIKDMPYTYTVKIMMGNTTKNINEHLPTVLIEKVPILIAYAVFIGIAMFTKVKLRLKDWFLAGGMGLLAIMSRRQISMLVLFGGFVLGELVAELFEKYDKKGTDRAIKFITTAIGEILTIVLVLAISYVEYKPNMNDSYINTNSYPVEAAKWIKDNLDYENIKLYNDYNYGSYLLLNDIPVFIDSRCDLYTPEFNGKYDKAKKKYVGEDIFTDYINISSIGTYYDTKFQTYGITHVMTKTNSKLNMLISRDDGYKQIYKDKNFVIYEREEIK